MATGSNLGDSCGNLHRAKQALSAEFDFIAESRIYQSGAVEFENQPDFFNQVLEFKLPSLSPEETLRRLLAIETSMGRQRLEWRGPRTIDIDIIFWGLSSVQSESLTIPHPRWAERSFIVRPLRELPFFQTLEKCFTIPESFKIEASPINT